MDQTKPSGKPSRARTRPEAASSAGMTAGDQPGAKQDERAGDVASPGTGKRAPVSTRRAPAKSRSRATAQPGIEPHLAAILQELRDVRAMVEQAVPQPRSTDTSAADPILEGAADSLRRLLSDLIERRMESVVRDLVDVRREATAAASDPRRIAERVDQVLESLGTVKFEGQRFDALDPLIHVAVEERHENGVPDGVILETRRPGFRTGRGLVVCKAAVAVNRRA